MKMSERKKTKLDALLKQNTGHLISSHLMLSDNAARLECLLVLLPLIFKKIWGII